MVKIAENTVTWQGILSPAAFYGISFRQVIAKIAENTVTWLPVVSVSALTSMAIKKGWNVAGE